jgi:hypothetical protein
MPEVLNLTAVLFADLAPTMRLVDLFNAFVVIFVYSVIAFPLVGGIMLWKGFQLAKIPDFTFMKCWKIYLAGLCYAYLAFFAVRLIFGEPWPAVPIILFFGVPMVAIPFLGRNLSQRTVIVEALVIFLANSIMIGLTFTIPFFLSSSQPTAVSITGR